MMMISIMVFMVFVIVMMITCPTPIFHPHPNLCPHQAPLPPPASPVPSHPRAHHSAYVYVLSSSLQLRGGRTPMKAEASRTRSKGSSSRTYSLYNTPPPARFRSRSRSPLRERSPLRPRSWSSFGGSYKAETRTL